MIHFTVGDKQVPLYFMQRAFSIMVKNNDTDNTAGHIMDIAWKEYRESLAVAEREHQKRINTLNVDEAHP